MWHTVLRDSTFFAILTTIDHDLAERMRAAGCVWCGGRLHSPRYPRKPRGRPTGLGREYEWRLSFCCARDGCRRRMTPPSVRYLGRRVYLGVAVVLVSAMTHGLSVRRVAELHAHLGVGLRTLRRWRRWWHESFFEPSASWRSCCSRVFRRVDLPVPVFPTTYMWARRSRRFIPKSRPRLWKFVRAKCVTSVALSDIRPGSPSVCRCQRAEKLPHASVWRQRQARAMPHPPCKEQQGGAERFSALVVILVIRRAKRHVALPFPPRAVTIDGSFPMPPCIMRSRRIDTHL